LRKINSAEPVYIADVFRPKRFYMLAKLPITPVTLMSLGLKQHFNLWI